jgi:hypothetical protein
VAEVEVIAVLRRKRGGDGAGLVGQFSEQSQQIGEGREGRAARRLVWLFSRG